MATCRSCDGKGKVKLLRSAFPKDGYKAHKCWMCNGSGESAEPDVFKGWRYEKSRAETASRGGAI
jgi:DnaJ-class molecular chaperone